MAKRANINSDLMVIGFDLGYGFIKATSNFGHRVIMPSVWGAWKRSKFGEAELTRDHPGEQITDEDGSKYYVGELALSELRAEEQFRPRGRTPAEQKERVRLLMATIGKMIGSTCNGQNIRVVLSTGLPITHMGDREAVINTYKGVHRIETDVTHGVTVQIIDVRVMPQPMATLFSQNLTITGDVNLKFDPRDEYQEIGIVDIGTMTVDIAMIAGETQRFINGRSGGNEAGMHLVEDRISDQYQADYEEIPNYATVQKALREGSIQARGKKVSYQPVVRAGAESIRDACLMTIQDLWKRAITVSIILVTGGGAENDVIFNGIKGQYPQAIRVPDAQMANAVGYLSYAMAKLKE